MTKSSHTKTRRNQQQELIAALGLTPNVAQVGVDLFMEDFKRVLLESLLQSEVNKLTGRPFERNQGQQTFWTLPQKTHALWTFETTRSSCIAEYSPRQFI